jgi:hypothetical protein
VGPRAGLNECNLVYTFRKTVSSFAFHLWLHEDTRQIINLNTTSQKYQQTFTLVSKGKEIGARDRREIRTKFW